MKIACYFLLAAVFVWATAFSSTALADDIAPALYRCQPNSVMAKFDLFGNPVPGGPSQFTTGPNPTYPLDALMPFVGVPSSPGGNALVYPIALPNYIDPLPLKRIRVQYSWFGLPSAGATANTVNILPSPGGAFQLVNSTAPTNISGNIFHRWDDFELIPNPDSERFEIEFLNADPRWVIIDTISIPEPTSVAILLLGSAIGLVTRSRK